MFASWSPAEWTGFITAVITVLGGQVILVVKVIQRQTTKAEVTATTLATKVETTADTLATKVTDANNLVVGSHRTLESKVDDILDHWKVADARMEASNRMRVALTERVDGHETRLNSHDQILKMLQETKG